MPLPWQAAFPDLQSYSGYAWYRREFELPADWLAGEVLLHFGAVDYWCQVFVNGQLAGDARGRLYPVHPAHPRLDPARAQTEIACASMMRPRTRSPSRAGRTIARDPTSAAPPFDRQQYAARQAGMVHQCRRHLAGCDADGGAADLYRPGARHAGYSCRAGHVRGRRWPGPSSERLPRRCDAASLPRCRRGGAHVGIARWPAGQTGIDAR